MQEGIVISVYGAYYKIQSGDEIFYAKPSGKLRLQYKKDDFLLVGDRIKFLLEEDQAYIESILPRKNIFQRCNYNKKQIFASNIDFIVIVSSIDQPNFNSGLLDRVLIEAEFENIPSIIIINKIDLFNKEKHSKIFKKINYYEKIGYLLFKEEANRELSSSFIKSIFSKTIMLIGESGVGKSTIFNALVQQKIQKTHKVNDKNQGVHTTTNPTLYQTEEGTIIDIPGVKEFGLQHLSKFDISSSLQETSLGHCRFDNCLHMHEPNCYIKKLVDSKEIPMFRYQSYLNMIQSLKDSFKYRRGNYL